MAGVCFCQTSVTLAGDFAPVRNSGVSVIARFPQGQSWLGTFTETFLYE